MDPAYLLDGVVYDEVDLKMVKAIHELIMKTKNAPTAESRIEARMKQHQLLELFTG